MKYILLLLTVFLFCGLFADACEYPPDTALVATVNGEPVIVREFLLIAERARTGIIRYYRVNYKIGYGEDFWNMNIDRQTPGDLLKQRTLDTLVSIKIQQSLAYQFGLIADPNYKMFLDDFAAENKRRLEAKNAGKVIYGPVQYTEEVYFNYIFSNMVIRLKDILGREVFKINDGLLMDAYEKNKDSLCFKGFHTEVRLMKLKEKFHPDSVLSVTDLVFNDTIPHPEEEDEVISMARETAKKMQSGAYSPVIEIRDSNYVIFIKKT